MMLIVMAYTCCSHVDGCVGRSYSKRTVDLNMIIFCLYLDVGVDVNCAFAFIVLVGGRGVLHHEKTVDPNSTRSPIFSVCIPASIRGVGGGVKKINKTALYHFVHMIILSKYAVITFHHLLSKLDESCSYSKAIQLQHSLI